MSCETIIVKHAIILFIVGVFIFISEKYLDRKYFKYEIDEPNYFRVIARHSYAFMVLAYIGEIICQVLMKR